MIKCDSCNTVCDSVLFDPETKTALCDVCLPYCEPISLDVDELGLDENRPLIVSLSFSTSWKRFHYSNECGGIVLQFGFFTFEYLR